MCRFILQGFSGIADGADERRRGIKVAPAADTTTKGRKGFWSQRRKYVIPRAVQYRIRSSGKCSVMLVGSREMLARIEIDCGSRWCWLNRCFK